MAYDIAEAFRRVEEELISSMIRNLKRHRAEETKEGFLWTQWQVEQLAALEEYRRRNRKKFSSEFSQIHKVVGKLINAAREEGNMHQEEEILKAIRDGAKLHKNPDTRMNARFFRMNDRKMNALIKATQDDFREGERAILRQADDQYRRVIFDAQVYANSGAATYEKAVDMATKDFLRAGIQCVEYSNGARHTLSDYADMAIRTAQKRAYLTGEGEKRQEWGTALVIMNKRTDACPKCLPFSGKVMIDDVWSGGKPDGKHMLISTAMERGLYHPRCRDSHTTYFPGISTAEDKGWTKEELEALEKDEIKREKLIYAENQAEKYDRMARHSLDEENQRKYETRAEEWGEKSEELTERRKQRLAQRRAAEDTPVKKVVFDDRVSEEQREIIEQLSSQYQTRLQKVDIGAEKAAGEVDMSGASMKLSDKHANTAIHEFAHTLANSSADKYGLTNDQGFWKEIKKIRREYMKDVEGDPSRWISAYEHSGRSLDEFMAEAFTHAKMREMGLDIPGKYGSDFTYSQKVLDAVNRHFGKEDGIAEARSIIEDIINGEGEEPPINWPKRGERMGKERNKAIRKYGHEKGIDIGGLADTDLSIESAHEVIDDAAKYLESYPELKEGHPNISFTAVYMNDSRSFASTTNHLITINADAYRNLEKLEEEYQILVEKHWFPQGTNHHALIAHEIGHVIHHRYPEIDPIEIAMRISGKRTRTELKLYLDEYLSEYAGYYTNGQEIISESYACFFTGVNNDFALKFVEECDKIIKKKREGAL